jgi:hypothetical protein
MLMLLDTRGRGDLEAYQANGRMIAGSTKGGRPRRVRSNHNGLTPFIPTRVVYSFAEKIS